MAERADDFLRDIALVRHEKPELQLACGRAERFLEGLSGRIDHIPVGDVVCLSEGVQLVWRVGDRHLRVLFSRYKESQDYIYTATTESGRVISSRVEPADSSYFAESICWLEQIQAIPA
jgi:hypothetical protein